MPGPHTPAQEAQLKAWLGDFRVLEDMSWGLQGITVLKISSPRHESDLVCKSSVTSHHIDREIRAYLRMTGPLGAHAPTMLHYNKELRLVVSGFVPGVLAEGSPYEVDEDVFFQAGELLRRFHTPAGVSNSYEPAALNKIQEFLPRAAPLVHPALLEGLRALVDSHEPVEATLVATHGDYQPRNWIVDDGVVRVIDFGRAGYRPWVTDLSRIHHKYFITRPDLEAAFFMGYGRKINNSDRSSWRLENYLQCLGTIVWAHDAGDPGFEEEGRRMLERVVSGQV